MDDLAGALYRGDTDGRDTAFRPGSETEDKSSGYRGGATFRAWAPRATAVYLNGVFDGVSRVGRRRTC